MTISRDAMLRIIVCVHFIFVSMVLMADWLPSSYHLNQITILALGILATIHHENVIQIELLMWIKLISVIIDSVAIGMYFQIGKNSYATRHDSSYFIISAFCAILLVILKPVMLLILNKIRQDRLNNSVFDTWATTSGYGSVGGR